MNEGFFGLDIHAMLALRAAFVVPCDAFANVARFFKTSDDFRFFLICTL
jgi:hypothetical protein